MCTAKLHVLGISMFRDHIRVTMLSVEINYIYIETCDELKFCVEVFKIKMVPLLTAYQTSS